jgi:hypothetical protein
MGSGKFIGMGAGGAVSSCVVYSRAASARDASIDRSRGRRRAAEKKLLGEQKHEAEAKRRVADARAGDATKASSFEAATSVSPVAATETEAAAPEKVVPSKHLPEALSETPSDTARETFGEPEVDARAREPMERKHRASSRSTRRARGRGGRATASTPSGSQASDVQVVKNQRRFRLSPFAAVAAPFGLLLVRRLFRSRRGAPEPEATDAAPDLRAVRALVAELAATKDGAAKASELSKLLRERDGLAREARRARVAGSTASKKSNDTKRNHANTNAATDSFDREPLLSLRTKAAVARVVGGAAGDAATAGRIDAQRVTDLDKVVGFQARELRFLRLALAEKDRRISQLTRRGGTETYAEADATHAWGSVSRAANDERSADVSGNAEDAAAAADVEADAAEDADADATVDPTSDLTVDEVLGELTNDWTSSKKRKSTKPAVPLATGNRANAADQENVPPPKSADSPGRRGGGGGDDAARFLNPAQRIVRGRSRVHRISPTRRQQETQSRSALRSVHLMR